MKIFLPPLEISDDEGFSPDKDLFGRKEFGDGLTRLITNVDDPLVIALDGQWGSGKTTFLKMWAGELRKQSYPVVFFDAFANDYMSDAFLAIAGQIIALAEEKKKSDSPQTKAFVDKAKRAAKALLRSSFKIGVKAATLGALDGHEVEGVTKDLVKDIAKEASDLEDKYIGELLTRQAQEKDAIEQFKLSLGQLSESLVDENQSGESNSQNLKKPLVFIIDELDRCRPDFALSFLERIKHFFSVPNVCFVLGIHNKQLENSVRAFYGDGIDAHNYLQKFIHFTFSIRSDEDHRYSGMRESQYVQEIFKRHDFPNSHLASGCVDSISKLVATDVLSLRSVERIMSTCALVVAFHGYGSSFRNQVIKQEIAIGLIILRVIGGDLYQKAKDGKLDFDEFSSRLKISKSDSVHNDDYFVALWRYLLAGEDNEKFDFVRSVGDKDRLELVGKCARQIVERTGR